MKKETLMRFKRVTAAGLVAAVLALGTSCGFKPSGPTNTTTNVVKPPFYDDTIIGKDASNATVSYQETVKEMINEDKYFGQNFSYTVKELNVTGISVEDASSTEIGTQADQTPVMSARITTSFIARVQNKTTSEMSTISDSISYVTDNQAVVNLIGQKPKAENLSTFVSAVNTGTQEKLALVAQGQVDAQDQVVGSNVNVDEVYMQLIKDNIGGLDQKARILDMKKQGFHIVSILPVQPDHKVIYNETITDGKVDSRAAVWYSPTGQIQIISGSFNSGIRFYTTLYILFENTATGEQRLGSMGMAIHGETQSDEAGMSAIDEIVEWSKNQSIIDVDKIYAPKHVKGYNIFLATLIGKKEMPYNEMLDKCLPYINIPGKRISLVWDGSSEDVNEINDYDKLLIASTLINNTSSKIIMPYQIREK